MKSLRKYGKNRKTKRNVNKKTKKRTLNKKRYNRKTRKNKIIIGGQIEQAIKLLNDYFNKEIITDTNNECENLETCKTPESKSGQTIKLCDCENVPSQSTCDPAVYKGDVLSSGSLFFKQDDHTISTEPKVMNFLAQRVLKSLIFKDEMKNNAENRFENFNELCNKTEGRFTSQKKIFMKGKLYKYTDPLLTNNGIPLIYVSLEELLNKEKRVKPFIKYLEQLVNPENIQQPSQENTIVNNKEEFIINAIHDLLMSNNNIKDDYKDHNIYYHIIKTSCDVLLNLHSALQFHHCDPKIAQIFITNSQENGVKGLIGDFDKSTFSLNIGLEEKCYRIILRQPGTLLSGLKKKIVQTGGTYFEQQRYHPKPKENPHNEIKTFYSSFILLFAQFEDAIYREVAITFPEIIIDNIKSVCKEKLIGLFKNIGQAKITLSEKLPYTSYVHAKLNSDGISEGFLKDEYLVDDYKKILNISSKEIKRHKTASQATNIVPISDKEVLESFITLKDDGINDLQLTKSHSYKNDYNQITYNDTINVNVF